jgi:hypothetical protein
MTPKLLDSLNETDRVLVGGTDTKALAGLDEDALLDLQARVRRTRNKHVGVYRRAGAAKVAAKGARGAARRGNEQNLARAEVFEDALARVSRAVSAAARASAAELKAERLSQVRKEIPVPAKKAATKAVKKAAKKAPTRTAVPAKRAQAARQTPASKKRVASTRAVGARRQAKRDQK